MAGTLYFFYTTEMGSSFRGCTIFSDPANDGKDLPSDSLRARHRRYSLEPGASESLIRRMGGVLVLGCPFGNSEMTRLICDAYPLVL